MVGHAGIVARGRRPHGDRAAVRRRYPRAASAPGVEARRHRTGRTRPRSRRPVPARTARPRVSAAPRRRAAVELEPVVQVSLTRGSPNSPMYLMPAAGRTFGWFRAVPDASRELTPPGVYNVIHIGNECDKGSLSRFPKHFRTVTWTASRRPSRGPAQPASRHPQSISPALWPGPRPRQRDGDGFERTASDLWTRLPTRALMPLAPTFPTLKGHLLRPHLRHGRAAPAPAPPLPRPLPRPQGRRPAPHRPRRPTVRHPVTRPAHQLTAPPGRTTWPLRRPTPRRSGDPGRPRPVPPTAPCTRSN